VQQIPWLIVFPITLPLKVFATQLSAGTAVMLGWPVAFTHNLIEVKGQIFQVDSPCSGLNSIVGLTFAWLIASMTFSLRLTKVLLLMPAVWAAAIVLNALRLFLTIAWALWVDKLTAFTAHDIVGYITFGLGLMFIIWLGQQRNPK
jgi:exosortase